MTIGIPVILSAAAFLLLLAAILFQGRWIRQARAREQVLQGAVEALGRDLSALQRDFGALCSGANGIGSHLSRVDRQLMRINERQEQFERRDGVHQEYEQAARLIRGGAAIDEVMQQCNLTRAEAELLARLHLPSSGGRDGAMRSVA